MNWLDFIIVICIVTGIIKGLFDGLVKQVISLIALFASILFAGYLAALIRPLITALDILPVYLEYPVACVFSFILIFGVMGLLGRLLTKVINWAFLGCLNRVAGGVIGMTLVVVVLSLLFNLLIIFDRNSRVIKKQTKEESVLFIGVQSIVPRLYPYIKHKVKEGIDQDSFDKWKEKDDADGSFSDKVVESEAAPDKEKNELIEI